MSLLDDYEEHKNTVILPPVGYKFGVDNKGNECFKTDPLYKRIQNLKPPSGTLITELKRYNNHDSRSVEAFYNRGKRLGLDYYEMLAKAGIKDVRKHISSYDMDVVSNYLWKIERGAKNEKYS